MARYIKKPIPIEAIKWDGSEQSWNDIILMGCPLTQDETCASNEVIIPTLEDGSKSQVKHIATVGDYIVKGIEGEFYPCKPNIFEKCYDLVNTDPNGTDNQ